MKHFNFIHDFTDDEIQILNRYRDKQSNARLKLRFAALVLPALKTGITVVASALGKTVITIENWYRQYISEGIDSLDHFNYKPRQPYLNFRQ